MKTPANLDWHAGPAYWTKELEEVEGATPTAAFVFVVAEKHLAMTKVIKRGWEVPGGHIDEGETPKAAAIRELQEEAGLVITDATFLAALYLEENAPPYPSPSSLHFFLAHLDSMPKLAASLECDDARWVELSQIPVLCANKSWLPLLADVY